jgi:hypothetical protein
MEKGEWTRTRQGCQDVKQEPNLGNTQVDSRNDDGGTNKYASVEDILQHQRTFPPLNTDATHIPLHYDYPSSSRDHHQRSMMTYTWILNKDERNRRVSTTTTSSPSSSSVSLSSESPPRKRFKPTTTNTMNGIIHLPPLEHYPKQYLHNTMTDDDDNDYDMNNVKHDNDSSDHHQDQKEEKDSNPYLIQSRVLFLVPTCNLRKLIRTRWGQLALTYDYVLKHMEKNPQLLLQRLSKVRMVVMEEASQLSLVKGCLILQHILQLPELAAIAPVGDDDQLLSQEPGRFLNDFILWESHVTITRLHQQMRVDRDFEAIHALTQSIRNGRVMDLKPIIDKCTAVAFAENKTAVIRTMIFRQSYDVKIQPMALKLLMELHGCLDDADGSFVRTTSGFNIEQYTILSNVSVICLHKDTCTLVNHAIMERLGYRVTNRYPENLHLGMKVVVTNQKIVVPDCTIQIRKLPDNRFIIKDNRNDDKWIANATTNQQRGSSSSSSFANDGHDNPFPSIQQYDFNSLSSRMLDEEEAHQAAYEKREKDDTRRGGRGEEEKAADDNDDDENSIELDTGDTFIVEHILDIDIQQSAVYEVLDTGAYANARIPVEAVVAPGAQTILLNTNPPKKSAYSDYVPDACHRFLVIRPCQPSATTDSNTSFVVPDLITLPWRDRVCTAFSPGYCKTTASFQGGETNNIVLVLEGSAERRHTMTSVSRARKSISILVDLARRDRKNYASNEIQALEVSIRFQRNERQSCLNAVMTLSDMQDKEQSLGQRDIRSMLVPI